MQPVDPRLVPPGLGSRLGPTSPDTCLVARADFARKIREQRRGQRPLKPARTKIRENKGGQDCQIGIQTIIINIINN